MPFIEDDMDSVSQHERRTGKLKATDVNMDDECVMPARSARGLHDLPFELLSQIASYLPLDSLITFTSLHSSFRALAQSPPLTPFAAPILQAILAGSPYPPSLAQLAGTHPYLPPALFLRILVRAPPKYILEQLELPRWSDDMWREAFERRFLPSWRRYRVAADTWRAAFLKVIRRLDHRASGCTHDESWTASGKHDHNITDFQRFLTLHRSGSASLNRIYSRNFDPHEIFSELKLQNNFVAQPTQIRLVCQLQDVRILAVGVLYSPTSLFINHNAHDLLHPPLLRMARPMTPPPDPTPTHVSFTHHAHPQTSDRTPFNRRLSENPPAADAGAPLARSITTESRTITRSPTAGITATLASFLPGRTRRQSEATSLGSRLTRMRSGGSTSSSAAGAGFVQEARRRTMSFGRARQAAEPALLVHEPESPAMVTEASVPEVPRAAVDDIQSETALSQITTVGSLEDMNPTKLLYRPMIYPTPAPCHRYYPNHTPGGHDLRIEHLEGDEVESGYNDGVKTEWDDTDGDQSWVGPMLLIAQLRSTEAESMPFDGPANVVDLGSHGTYASLGFEDLDALAPWVTLVASDANGTPGQSSARRDGLGFGS